MAIEDFITTPSSDREQAVPVECDLVRVDLGVLTFLKEMSSAEKCHSWEKVIISSKDTPANGPRAAVAATALCALNTALPHRNFSGVHLTSANLSNGDFTSCNFSGAKLAGE